MKDYCQCKIKTILLPSSINFPAEFSDILTMSFVERLKIAIEVAKNPYVIFITAVTVVVIALGNYVVSYTKKPRKQKPVKTQEAPSAPKGQPGEANAAEGNPSS